MMTPTTIVLIIIFALIFLWLIFIAAPAYCMYAVIFGKGKCRPHESTDLSGTYYEKYQDEIRKNIEILKCRFTGEASIVARDGTRLCAELADHGQRKTAVLIHGYHSSPTNNCYAYGNLLYENGYDLVLPYQRAHGKSEGKRSTFGLLEQYDLLDWLEWIKQRSPENEIIIVGISMGGTTIGLAMDKIHDTNIKAAVLDCAFTSPRKQMMFDCRRRHVPFYSAVIPIMNQFVKHDIKQDIDKSTIDALSKSKLPVLFIHGTDDEAVPCEFTKLNYNASSSDNKEILLVDGANHTLAITAGGQLVRQKLIDFLRTT